MALDKILPFKKLGHHISPSLDLLLARLRRKLLPTQDQDHDYADFPIIDKDLYSDDPWNVLNDNDPWEIRNNSEENKPRKRTIYVFTPVIRSGSKRFSRTAGTGKWEGSTGVKPVERENGIVIGFDSYFDFKFDNDHARNTIIRGHWSMHEYRLPEEDNWNHVVCKITHVVDKALRIQCAWPKTPLDICFDNFKNWGLFTKKQQLDDRDQEVEENVRNVRVKQETEISDEDEQYANDLVDMLIESNDGGEENNQVGVYDESRAVLTNTPSNQFDCNNENPGREVVTTQPEVNDMDDLIDWNRIDGENLMEPLNELNSSENQLSISYDDLMKLFGDDQVAGSSNPLVSKNENSVMEVNVHDNDDVYSGLEDLLKLDEPPNYSLDGQSLRFEQDQQLQDNLWSNEERLLEEFEGLGWG